MRSIRSHARSGLAIRLQYCKRFNRSGGKSPLWKMQEFGLALSFISGVQNWFGL